MNPDLTGRSGILPGNSSPANPSDRCVPSPCDFGVRLGEASSDGPGEEPALSPPPTAIAADSPPSADEPATGADAEFWSKRFGRAVTRAELFEIQTSLVGLFELLSRVKKESI